MVERCLISFLRVITNIVYSKELIKMLIGLTIALLSLPADLSIISEIIKRVALVLKVEVLY